MITRRLVSVAGALLLLLAGCGSDGESPSSQTGSEGETASSFDEPYDDVAAYPVFASSEIVVGDNRFLVGLLDSDDAPIGSPDIEVAIDFYDLEESESEPVSHADTRWLYTMPGERGLYVAYVQFDHAGKWGAEVTISGDGLDETVRGSFKVQADATTPAIGDPAPRSKTPVALTRKQIARISTDPHPTPRFYDTSVAEAIRSGEPFVVTFATPKFCSSQVCGPTLDVVEGVAKEWPDVTFIHVEVYSNLDDPSNLEVVPSVTEWGLPSEPWVFVVDARGRVAAKYEGAVAPRELSDVLGDL